MKGLISKGTFITQDGSPVGEVTGTYYCGKPIEELTREELIQALHNAATSLFQQHTAHEEMMHLAELKYRPQTMLGRLFAKARLL